ncbi:MAG TPA: DUF2520 domain-containing protein [Cytophagales bacterium]|nr:DUF2520 domain-containing protein [Cytophagales bacterium]HAA19808.1 DUF2520 domain-containing protein [Cytophagales bacterium]HAP64236.1 DUF2520 domain-containing protein [Cytophagales bacterium]
MAKRLRIGLIGSGNVAWHLGPALENAGHHLVGVYSPTAKNARALQKRLYEAQLLSEPDFTGVQPHVVIMAVKDDVIPYATGEAIIGNNTLLVHTSGSKPLSALGYASTSRKGVFYPLQTFSKDRKVDFQHVPLLVEAEHKEDERLLLELGKTLSKQVTTMSSANRTKLHVSAVFACNFTNHLLTISQQIMRNESLDFELLKPLIAETLSKSLEIGPENAQTGPAVRGDVETLEKHMQFLDKAPRLAEIYQKLSQHILDMYTP